MSGKPAAFMGVYTDLKFLSGLKVARVTLEIPIERSQEFIGMFGTPDRTNPAWCAIAKIDPALMRGDVPATPEPVAEPVVTETKRSDSLAWLAGVKCRDFDFCRWMYKAHRQVVVDLERAGIVEEGGDYSDNAPKVLRAILGVKSRAELDKDPTAADRFKRLLTDYDMRNTVRS